MRKFLARPSPDYRLLIKSLISGVKFDSSMLFFNKGRDALVRGLEILDIAPGAVILVPAYMCDSTIKPLRQRGYQLIFIDVQDDFNFDLNLVDTMIKEFNVKVILAVHYFGFSSKIQSLVELCNTHEVKVIEDCSHSFLTSIGGEPVGSFGHIAIFSMRKTLPVYDGGALRINETIEYESQNKSGDSGLGAELAYLISRLLESLVSLIGVPNIYSTKLTGLKERMRALLPYKHKHNDNNNNIIFNSITPVRPSFQLQAYLGSKEYESTIKESRDYHYRILEREIGLLGLKVMAPKSLKDCFPQCLVVVDETKMLCRWLRDKGVGAVAWPGPELPDNVSMYPTEFPITIYLNENLVMLPIHQTLSHRDCMNMIRLLKQWTIDE
tara:strand:+ start:707 stop:1852 length:1146 start_codon:yes stop_codon:yes gene_type:complete